MHAQRFLKLVTEAKNNVQETDVSTVWKRMEANNELLLIDVREESEYAAAHVPGAVHIGKGILEREIERFMPDTDQEIILYCQGGFRSAIAAESLGRMGYTQVISMDGGFREWAQAGLPINTP
jgi:rhodanese-related sulfurtransferase